MARLELDFGARPSAVAYMLRALYPGFLRSALPFPPLRARWRGASPGLAPLRSFLRMTGLEAGGGLPILYPQVFTFPLQMAILTHPACPLPIWKVLQIRNHLLQHRTIPPGAALDAEASVSAQRVLEKGVELDIHMSVRLGDDVAWEGVTTFYYRGRFGEPSHPSPLAAAPTVADGKEARWRTSAGGGFRFAGISGDYNGIHWSDAYARLFGFRGALHHPHAVVGQGLSRLAGFRSGAQRLDLWLKGPVYYGSEVGLRSRNTLAGVEFALTAGGSDRPAMVGRWSEAPAGRSLVAVSGGLAATARSLSAASTSWTG